MSPINFNVKPEISIILITYNRANYLKKAIESVINQTFKNWELLVIDDGSKDNTFEIVNPFVENNERIRYFRHTNRGLAHARNAGIQACFGNYITFLDSDDSYKSNHLESRLEYMESHPELEAITGGFELEEEIFIVDYYQQDKTISLRDCVMCPTIFGKRYVFFQIKGFQDLPYGEDTDLWNRIEDKFKTERITKPETYVYTRAENSFTKSIYKEKIKS
ncbi:glycosyltransferase family 2 protein [Aphanothece sacrum]|uniref:Glycosyl transferase n=1 Tax=Aphanothece sacrum FPU1 TaxID=1920663 RepID=A0A401IHF4_APHSA|nr:glycosyltransferase family 2 protein [Aphanothece sacrum]GBF80674.1 glycosyl transferase [Aphanothece sacrum FPU1]GBF83168.1 glycosyl transferase [Aphanothece sacrum FPU3]